MDNVFVPSTWRRLAAYGIDQLLRTVFYLPFAKIFFLLVFTEDEVHITLWEGLALLLVPTMYEMIFLILMQATPGKWLMGLKVVPFSQPHQHLHWQQCVLRPLVNRLSFFFSWAIFVLAFFRYDRTHLADWVAETRVVQGTPRLTRASWRPILGSILFVIYFTEGLSSAGTILQAVNWREGQIELRALVDSEAFAVILDEYEEYEE